MQWGYRRSIRLFYGGDAIDVFPRLRLIDNFSPLLAPWVGSIWNRPPPCFFSQYKSKALDVGCETFKKFVGVKINNNN